MVREVGMGGAKESYQSNSWDAYKRKHARYVLTSKRANIARSMINRLWKAIP